MNELDKLKEENARLRTRIDKYESKEKDFKQPGIVRAHFDKVDALAENNWSYLQDQYPRERRLEFEVFTSNHGKYCVNTLIGIVDWYLDNPLTMFECERAVRRPNDPINNRFRDVEISGQGYEVKVPRLPYRYFPFYQNQNKALIDANEYRLDLFKDYGV